METINYKKFCSEILKELPKRQKEVISRGFGLEDGNKETLESIGQDFGITRERVRQIENDAFSKIKGKIERYQKVFEPFVAEFKNYGGLKKEEIILSQLGGKNYQPQISSIQLEGKRFSCEFAPFQDLAENIHWYH